MIRKKGVYDDLGELALKLGLDRHNLSNLTDVSCKMLREWSGVKEYCHQFISLLEAVREKKEVEKRLDKARLLPT